MAKWQLHASRHQAAPWCLPCLRTGIIPILATLAACIDQSPTVTTAQPQSVAAPLTMVGPASTVTFDASIDVRRNGAQVGTPVEFHVERTRTPGGWRTTLTLGANRISRLPGMSAQVSRYEIDEAGNSVVRLSDGRALAQVVQTTRPAANSGLSDTMQALATRAQSTGLARSASTRLTTSWIDQLVKDKAARSAEVTRAFSGISPTRNADGTDRYVKQTAGQTLDGAATSSTGELVTLTAFKGTQEVVRVTNEYLSGPGNLSIKRKTTIRQPATQSEGQRLTTITLANVSIDGVEVR